MIKDYGLSVLGKVNKLHQLHQLANRKVSVAKSKIMQVCNSGKHAIMNNIQIDFGTYI